MDESFPRIDRTALSVRSIHDPPDDAQFWLSKTPEERFAAVELLRRINYGTSRTSERLQRFLEVVERCGRHKDLSDLDDLP